MTFPSIKSTEPFGDPYDALKILLPRWYSELEAESEERFHVGRVFPKGVDLVKVLPFIRIKVIGGNDNGLTDRPLVDLDVFHKTYAEAKLLANGARMRLLSYPHVAGSTVIDQVSTAMRPHDVPWDDDRIHRFYSSYNISTRR